MSAGKILIVDDEISICTTLCNLLMTKEYEVDYRLNAKEGLEAVKNDPALETVISDIMMPGMDGVEFLKEIKMFNSMMPVVIISGSRAEEHIEKTFKGHAFDYIMKPFEAEKIFWVISQSVSYYRMIRKFKSK
jgi:DNA-binding NtrC family response regulator